MTIVSMTGYAEAQGSRDGARWRWEAKSVNGRGLDVRLRAPPGFEAIDPVARTLVGERFRRGSIQMQLTFEPGDASRGLKIDAAALAAGAKIYSDNCAGCHGSAKGPSDWGAKGFYPRAPQFFQEGADVTPPEAYAAVHDGIRYSGMAAWRGQLKDDEMWKVANFVASIRAKNSGMKDMD